MTITYNLLLYLLSWVETRKEKLNKRKEKKKEKKTKSKFKTVFNLELEF